MRLFWSAFQFETIKLSKSTLFLFGCVWAWDSAYAQGQSEAKPGYIVLERGDTLRGSLEPIGSGDVARGVYFWPNAGGQRRLCPVKLLRAAGFDNGPQYETRKMSRMLGGDTLRVLMETLVKGRANLLRSAYHPRSNNIDWAYANSFSVRSYYVERSSGPYRVPVQLTEYNFRENLRSLFSDCPTPPVVKGQFTGPNLRRLLTEYNACTGQLSN